MAMITLRELMDYAAENNFGMPAFNVNNMEQVRAIMRAANEVNSPVILQGSAGARKYAGEPMLRHMIVAAVEMYPHIPVVMHQDHGSDVGVCLRAIQSGFTSVMMDGSLEADMKTPASYEYNAGITAEVVAIAHAGGVSVEGELGCLGSLETGMMGEEDGHGSDEKLSLDSLLTDPEEAAQFVKDTNVDCLAVAVGTSHGAYKFTSKPNADVLKIDQIRKIHERIPDTHIVMHGSSSVPEEWLSIINNYGGDMGQTYGVPVEAIVEGIKYGVRKVNIDTDLRMASTGAIRKHLSENTANFDPRKFYNAAENAMMEICKSRFEAFGCAGHASKIKAVGLEEMQARYANGSLNQTVR
ncbi:Fructose-bisphosphate aldolase class II [hydrothermal vent metagenome]|uniref:fructose-bisphosphate aldolase n=1 Tax=hydrothermal vent metagenome TaxID=652676 RepID=A0A3B0WN93_9ZZZZ